MAQDMTAVHHPVPRRVSENDREHHQTGSLARDVREDEAERDERERERRELAEGYADVERDGRHARMSAGVLPVVEQRMTEVEAAEHADHARDEPAAPQARGEDVFEGQ